MRPLSAPVNDEVINWQPLIDKFIGRSEPLRRRFRHPAQPVMAAGKKPMTCFLSSGKTLLFSLNVLIFFCGFFGHFFLCAGRYQINELSSRFCWPRRSTLDSPIHFSTCRPTRLVFIFIFFSWRRRDFLCGGRRRPRRRLTRLLQLEDAQPMRASSISADYSVTGVAPTGKTVFSWR